MPQRRRYRRTTPRNLMAHELSIVSAERPRGRTVGRIRSIGTPRPLPHDTERILKLACARRDLPFEFARQMLAGPACESIRFVVADVTDGKFLVDRQQSLKRENVPFSVDFAPISRRRPVFGGDRRPAIG